ncbi:uncharacterized protein [Triticum aestivum]|uniref:uncharacterized protein n=1 Tax=Triticum aestivum TaxID=4565 RepID=UPI001D023928|nr:uncharacterized protein LOC123154176 [Triticum aestivum]
MGANQRSKSPSPRPSPATLRNGSTAHRRAAHAAPTSSALMAGGRALAVADASSLCRTGPHKRLLSMMDLRGQGVSIGTSGHAPPSPFMDDIQHRQFMHLWTEEKNGNEEEKNSNIIICESNKHLGGVNAFLGLTSNQ